MREVETADVVGHERRRVAFGVDGDEQRANRLVRQARKTSEICASVGGQTSGAMGVAEIDQERVALQVGVGDRFAIGGL